MAMFNSYVCLPEGIFGTNLATFHQPQETTPPINHQTISSGEVIIVWSPSSDKSMDNRYAEP